MKKTLVGILMAAMVLSMGATSAFAAGRGCGRGQGRGGNCVNASASGVCNNSGACNFVDEDNDGICDNCNTYHGNGCGQSYVDADGDGVCDNYASGGQRQGRGHGCRRNR